MFGTNTLLRAMASMEKRIMTKIADLQAADSRLGSSVAAAIAQHSQDVQNLTNALKTGLGNGDITGDAATQVQTVIDDINSRAQALDNAFNGNGTSATNASAGTAGAAGANAGVQGSADTGLGSNQSQTGTNNNPGPV